MNVRARVRRLLGSAGAATLPEEDRRRLERLEQRVKHLEALAEGLQDAVHRDSLRHEERMAQIERKTEPEVLAKALSDDARRRGL
jgi:predicted  nucleic acid-binding Zn-ribbon protein